MNMTLINTKNKKVFLKICNNKKLSMGTLSLCINAFSQNVKKVLSFGEPCSNIPLIKNQKKMKKIILTPLLISLVIILSLNPL